MDTKAPGMKIFTPQNLIFHSALNMFKRKQLVWQEKLKGFFFRPNYIQGDHGNNIHVMIERNKLPDIDMDEELLYTITSFFFIGTAQFIEILNKFLQL